MVCHRILVNTQGTGSGGVPVGSVIAWPLAADPDGPEAGKWIECDGHIVDASKYPKLAALMTYVPDYRGVFLRGYGSVITSNFGTVNHQSNELGILQGDAIRNITGRFGGDSYEAEYNIGAFWGSNGGLGNTGTSVGCLHFFDASLVVPTANENRPVNRSVRWLIRAA